MRSAIYEGRIRHRRLAPRPHAFGYGIHLVHVDLDELEGLIAGSPLLSRRRFAALAFRRSDYLGAPDRDLREEVLSRVEEELGRRPAGRVGLVTQLRTFGYLFNPVSFYYCEDAEGELDAIVAEITNTPWSERRAYVLDAAGCGGELVFRFQKDFHVSPFFDLDQVYEWRFSKPAEELSVRMQNFEGGRVVFEAELGGHRRALTTARLIWTLVRYPLQPLRLHLAIYWQALRLYLKKTPFFVHPKKRDPDGSDRLEGASTA